MNRFQSSRAAAALALCGVMTAAGIQAQQPAAAPGATEFRTSDHHGAGEPRRAGHVDADHGSAPAVADGNRHRRAAAAPPGAAGRGGVGARCRGANTSARSRAISWLTVPNAKLVGRAVTMRYLPVRPDLMDAVHTLAKEGDWDYQYNVRAGEDLKKGDVVVVELGGMVDRATFLGDVTGLGMKTAGALGVIVDGGIRDLSEFAMMKDFPIFYRGAHASAMADQVGVQWNGPIRLGGITVLPGDIIVADAEGVQLVPPQLVADVIKDAEDTVYTENFKREMMATKKYRARDIYPKLSPELEKLFEEWKKTHKKEGVKPNVGG